MRTLRQKGIDAGYGHEPGFRWRGSEVTRLEGLSDAVFAFAVTLLVVSLEVPRTFDELLGVMSGFPAFGACFTLLFLIWHKHYVYFRRYGLQDTWTVTLTGALLFLVLFYIYPLKFMFTSLFQQMLGWGAHTPQVMPAIQAGQARALMLIYSAGFLGVFAVFVLMYLHAWRRRAALGLDAVEIFDTVSSIQHAGIFVGVAVLSIVLAAVLPQPLVGLAGWVYFLIGPAAAFQGSRRGRRRRRLESKAGAVTA
jgi:uncharacterized membrane protein